MALNTTPAASDADSYFAITDADAYFSARGEDAWGGAASDAKEQAARKATSYLDNAYNGRWMGVKSLQAQALAWPRLQSTRGWLLQDPDGFDIGSAVIPASVKRAAMEAALLIVRGVNLEPTLVRGGAIKSIDKGVGPLRKAIVYADGAPATDRYLAIEGLLRGYVDSGPGSSVGNVRLVRS